MVLLSRGALTAALATTLASVPTDAFRYQQRKRTRGWTACGAKGPFNNASGQGIPWVSGEPAAECEWRWQVALTSYPGKGPFCGGMLLHPEWVLTAAHCVPEAKFNVMAGGHHPEDGQGGFEHSPEQNRGAVEVIKHPQYDNVTSSWDFALVRLDSPMEIHECAGTVCLPRRDVDVPPGQKCWISGWGTLDAHEDVLGMAEVTPLGMAEVSTMSNEDCADSGYGQQITSSMLCAQGRTAEGTTDAFCKSDAGGPLVCEDSGKWTLYGATSWGKDCKNNPGVWARVHDAVDWIYQTMEAKDRQ